MMRNNSWKIMRQKIFAEALLIYDISVHQKSEKERKRNAKRNARSCSEKGTEQERVPDFLKRNAEGTRS